MEEKDYSENTAMPTHEDHIIACIYGKGEPGDQVCIYPEMGEVPCNKRMYTDNACPLKSVWDNVMEG